MFRSNLTGGVCEAQTLGINLSLQTWRQARQIYRFCSDTSRKITGSAVAAFAADYDAVVYDEVLGVPETSVFNDNDVGDFIGEGIEYDLRGHSVSDVYADWSHEYKLSV
jgi:hypothetical protein